MLINIRTSEENKQVVQELTRKLNLNFENYISRIAFAYSLSKNIILDLNKDLKDSKGKEYKDDILFGTYRHYYIALICQHYGIFKTDKDISKYIKMHIDHGLQLLKKLFDNSPNLLGSDFLFNVIDSGVNYLEETNFRLEHVKNLHQSIKKDYYAQLIKLLIGKSSETGENIYFRFNDSSIHNNAHIAVAGNTGTGKTYFALNLLKQIVKESKDKVNFVYLDFKGLKKEDHKSLKSFFEATKSTLIDAPHKPFPLNPLSFIDNINETNKILGINKLVDIISSYSNIGKNQQQTLKEAIKTVFSKKKDGEYPTFKEIYKRVIETEGKKASTLTEILESLGELDFFENEVNVKKTFLNKNYYFSLSGDLSNSVRFTCVFLIINYIYNTFMNMENAPIEKNIQGMRYVFLIDEAHVIFKERKSQDILEKMLREIRSKGVSIILLSQGIEEFIQPYFDFSSMSENVFLFDVKDKNNIKQILKFLGFGSEMASKIKSNFQQLEKYQLISNIKENSENSIIKLK